MHAGPCACTVTHEWRRVALMPGVCGAAAPRPEPLRLDGARGRTWVAGEMYQSLESRRDRVTSVYQDLLGRAPDAAGRDFWARRILARGDLALAVDLAASGEYASRAVVRFP